MGLGTWLNSQAKKLDWISIQLMKLSVFTFALMVAKLWKPILGLDWYWYSLIFILAAIEFSNWNPAINEVVTITATIHNLGQANPAKEKAGEKSQGEPITGILVVMFGLQGFSI